MECATLKSILAAGSAANHLNKAVARPAVASSLTGKDFSILKQQHRHLNNLAGPTHLLQKRQNFTPIPSLSSKATGLKKHQFCSP